MALLTIQEARQDLRLEFHIWFTCDGCGIPIHEAMPHWSDGQQVPFMFPPTKKPPESAIADRWGKTHFCLHCLEYAPRNPRGATIVRSMIGRTKLSIDWKFRESIHKRRNSEKPQRPRKGISRSLRYDILKRDCFKCVLCGRSAGSATLEIDHIQPVARGGSSDLSNLRTLCFDCNRGKGAKIE
jgi:hypothetical protein